MRNTRYIRNETNKLIVIAVVLLFGLVAKAENDLGSVCDALSSGRLTDQQRERIQKALDQAATETNSYEIQLEELCDDNH
jgi:hypothetical protein